MQAVVLTEAELEEINGIVKTVDVVGGRYGQDHSSYLNGRTKGPNSANKPLYKLLSFP